MKTPWRGAGGTSVIAGLAAALLALLSGCGSSTASAPAGSTGPAAGGGAGSGSPSGSPTSGVQPGGPPTPGPSAGVTTVTDAQNGITVHVAVGGTVELVDFPSNWFPRSSDSAVLADPAAVPGRSLCKERTEVANPPGVPCVQIPLDYVAKAAGTAVLTAHRTQCGEAMRCVPPESYDYRLTVVVG